MVKFKTGDLIKLDLGCGQNKQQGFIGVDIAGTPDVVWDLTKFPYEFCEDESVSQIVTSHFIEHLTGSQFMQFMDECYRILAPEGTMVHIAPYYNSMRAGQDPTHKTFISEARFYYFNKQWRINNKLDHYPITCDFDFSWGYNYYPDWQNRSQIARDFAVKHYTNVVMDIQVHMVKRPNAQ